MIKVAVVGAGAIAREHLRAFRDVPGVELAGIASRTRARAETLAEEFELPLVADSVDELYALAEPELAVVSVTIPSTREVCNACLEHPWTLLVEKPLGINFAETEAIVDRARQSGRQGYVAFNRRHYASINWSKSGIEESGGRRFIRIEDQEDTDSAAAEGHTPEVVRNWMFANAIHMVDLIRFLAPAPIAGFRVIRPFKGNAETLEVISEIRFENGDVALYECIWNAQGPWAATVTSRDRRYEMRPLENAVYQTRNNRSIHAMDPDGLDIKYKPGFYRQAEEAVRAAGGEPARLATFADALETTRLVQNLFGLANDRS